VARVRGGAGRAGGDLLRVALSAVLLTLCLPPYDLHLLAWVALVPVLLAIGSGSRLRAFWLPFATCYAFDFAHASWMLGIEGITVLNMGLPVLVHAAYFGGFGLVARALHRRRPQWDPLTFPAAWVVFEYFRFHLGFLSFPWGVLAYSQYTVLPVAGLAAWTGVHGVSFLIVAVNAALVSGIEAGRRGAGSARRVATGTALAAGAGALVFAALGAATPSGSEAEASRTLRVALVQSDTRSPALPGSAARDALFRRFSALTRQVAAERPALIAWPESSVRGRLPYDRSLEWELGELARSSGSYLLVGSSGQDKGAPGRQPTRSANSAFLFAPDGQPAGRYDKMLLLPFNEYLPLRGRLRWPDWIVADVTDAVPGDERTIFQAGSARFGVLICWENLFPEAFRRSAAGGVDFMVSMTNEAFIESPAAHYQMLAMNVFRAIENRVAIVRTATTGVSAVVEPSGRITARVRGADGSDVNSAGVLAAEVLLSAERSFYTRHGDWFVAACAAWLAVAGALAFSRRRETPALHEARGAGPLEAASR
jgi:apolipoprotein N-acyltransferase